MQPIVATVQRTYIQCPACPYEYWVTEFIPELHLEPYNEHAYREHGSLINAYTK